tara:strand:+ start:179 stop:415 length:237 start_codon:yes stop_codon:yes gene_type:complete
MIKALIFLFVILFVFLLFFFSSKFKRKTLILSLSILTIVMSVFTLALFLLENNSEEKLYNPPKFDGEKVIPGFFDEKN